MRERRSFEINANDVELMSVQNGPCTKCERVKRVSVIYDNLFYITLSGVSFFSLASNNFLPGVGTAYKLHAFITLNVRKVFLLASRY